MKILGFDLGDGESAVALLDGESTVEPRMMPLAGRTSMLSSVGRRGGRIVVGDEASVMSGRSLLPPARSTCPAISRSGAGMAASSFSRAAFTFTCSYFSTDINVIMLTAFLLQDDLSPTF